YANELVSSADDAMASGDFDTALAIYMEVLSDNPDNAEALDMALILSGELEALELGQLLLLSDVERAVELDDRERVQRDLQQLTSLMSAMPSWVNARFDATMAISEEQMADFEQWQALKIEGQALMDGGDFESAIAVIEGGLFLAQDAFGEEHWITISAKRDLGFAARQLGDAETADAFYSASYEMSATILGPEHPETQHIAELMSELFSAVGGIEEAAALRTQITETYQASLGLGHLATLEAMVNQARTFEAAGDYQTAVATLDGTCQQFMMNLSAYHEQTISCQSHLARLQQDTGSLDEAEKLLLVVRDSLAASSIRITRPVISNMMNLADVSWRKGEFEAAKDMLSGAILTSYQLGDADLGYTGKAYLARILASEGDVGTAVILTEDVVAFGESARADQPVQYYNALLELGALYQRRSQFAEAEAIFEESMLALLDIAGEYHPSTLVAMNNLGNIYEQMGLYDQAEPLLKQTLSSMEGALGISHPQTARTRNNLALLHESQGNFREAEPLYNSSYEHIVNVLGEYHSDALGMKNNLAYLYMMMENYEAAADLFEVLVEQWKVAAGPDHQDSLKTLNNLGRVYLRQGKLDDAEQTVTSALNARVRTLGGKHIDTIRSKIDLGAVYLAQDRLDEAEATLEDVLKLAEDEIGKQHPYTFEALNNLAKVAEAQNKLSRAIEIRELGMARRSTFLDRMLWVTGENAREGYIRLHRPELDEYLSLLALSNDPLRGKKAIDASLQRKGLLLKITSEIEQIAQLSVDPKVSSIANALESARKELASLTLSGPTADTQGRHSEALYQLELRVNELQGELGRASVRYRASIAGATADSLAEFLTNDTALVDFLMYKEGEVPRVLAGVVVKEDGEVRFDLIEFPDRGEIEDAVQEYRLIIQDDLADEEEVLEVGQLAYEVVWLPIQEAIGDVEYVYLIPDGVLNILPFSALMTEDEEYLIQTTDIHILTSGRDLLPNDYELAEGDYVIIAGPDYDADGIVGSVERAEAEGRRSAALRMGIRGAGTGLRGLSFAPLPGAEKEGRIITDRVEANEEASRVYFGADAQEQVLANLSSAPEILHVATHGFFLEADDSLRKRLLKMQRSSEIQVPPPGDNPLLRSGLAFAGINTNAQLLGDIDTVNDGVLTALEVLGLDLSGTRLVVLSACETGLGEIHEGEGVYGLRRSFQEAGVAEVISSLWEVSDAGTQALMTDFYDRVLAGTPARDALRDTQLALIDSPEWGYPYIWSAFMIVGSYESAGISIQ
ncbi:MAG: CHAT domain-containing protein/Tfp pilus assembly protein PilF, partial [Candidatus Azotimanducaceae bacterium]